MARIIGATNWGSYHRPIKPVKWQAVAVMHGHSSHHREEPEAMRHDKASWSGAKMSRWHRAKREAAKYVVNGASREY